MISVDSLLYEIDLRLNKLATNAHQEIPLENKIIEINNAQNALILNKVSSNNIYKLGLDAFKKRYQDLENLIENFDGHKLSPKLTDSRLNQYSVNIDDLDNYMFYIDSYAVADKEDCKNRVLATNADLVKHADLQLLLKDSNYKPSFEYQETIIDISSNKIHIYSDGTFAPKEFYVSYLRYPKKVDKEGYVNFDNSDSVNQDSELESYLKNELLDIVVEKLAMYTENIPAVQSAGIRKQTNE